MINTQTLINIYKAIDEIYNQGGKTALTNLLNNDIPEFFNSITFLQYCSNCNKTLKHYRQKIVTKHEVDTYIFNGQKFDDYKLESRKGIVKYYEDQLVCSSCYNTNVIIEKRAFDIEKEWMYCSTQLEPIQNPTLSAANMKLDYLSKYRKEYTRPSIKDTPFQILMEKAIKGLYAKEIVELRANIIKYIDKILYNLN